MANKEVKTPAIKAVPGAKGITDGGNSTLSTPRSNQGNCPGFPKNGKESLLGRK